MKQDPLSFWQKLQGTIALHDAIFETRKSQKINNQHKPKLIADIRKITADKEYNIGLNLVLNSTTSFHNLFKNLFISMDKNEFKRTQSVSQNYDTHLIKYNNRYKLLSSINLYSHTINVVVEAIKISIDNKLPQQVQDIVILLAVLHDFGKNQLIAKEFQFEKENLGKHHRISANYAKFIMFEESLLDVEQGITKELIDMVYTTLRSHHEEVKNNNMFLKLLINADTNARELELRGILRNQQVKGKK